MKDFLLVKLAIDVHATYGKLFDYPLFRSYQSEVLPLALDFYRKIDPASLRDILADLKRFSQHAISTDRFVVVKPVAVDKGGILIFPSKNDYVKYYRREMLSYSNLTAGCSVGLYYA